MSTPRWDRIARRSLPLVVLALVALPASAQLSTATVTGIIRDSSGGVVAEAKVLLHNVETSVDRSTSSNTAGNYLFLNVNPGRYTLEATTAGFKSSKLAEFTLAVNQTATI